jgi:hypothetical protein
VYVCAQNWLWTNAGGNNLFYRIRRWAPLLSARIALASIKHH